MRNSRKGAVNPVTVFVIAVVLAVIGVAAIGMYFFQAAAKRAADRKAETASARDLLGQVKDVAEGGKLGQTPDFPDTPLGRIQRTSYEWLRGQQTSTEAFMKELEEMNWDWVGGPESLRTKPNLEKSLAISAKAKELVRKHIAQLDAGVAQMIKTVEAQSDGTPAAQQFVAGFKSSASDPNGGFQTGRQTWVVLIKNIESLEDMMRFLLARSGRYLVNTQGGIEFDTSVSDREIDTYNEIVDRVDGYLQEINDLEKKRLELARKQLDQAGQTLGKP